MGWLDAEEGSFARALQDALADPELGSRPGDPTPEELGLRRDPATGLVTAPRPTAEGYDESLAEVQERIQTARGILIQARYLDDAPELTPAIDLLARRWQMIQTERNKLFPSREDAVEEQRADGTDSWDEPATQDDGS